MEEEWRGRGVQKSWGEGTLDVPGWVGCDWVSTLARTVLVGGLHERGVLGSARDM